MKRDSVVIYVVLLLVLQAVSVAFLWVANVLDVNSTGAFSVLLAANLIAFAMVLQVYRSPETVEKVPVETGAPPPQGTAAAPAEAATKPT